MFNPSFSKFRNMWICAILVLFPLTLKAEKIERIEIKGLLRISEEVLKQNISQKEGMTLKVEKLREDVKRIFATGYFDEISVYEERITGGVILIFYLKEKFYIRDVTFEGNKKIKKEDIEEVIKVKKRGFLDRASVEKDVKEIKKLYEKEGYFLAEIEPEIIPQEGNSVKVKYKIKEGERVKIRRIVISGNECIDDDEIKNIMETKEWGFFSFLTKSGRYEMEKLRTDLERIRAYYMDKGYMKVIVGEPSVEVSADKRWIYISIPVEEGKKYFIDEVGVENNKIYRKETLLKELKIRKGEPFSRSKVSEDILHLTKKFEDIGYANANVDPLINVNEQKRTVGIVYSIESGNLVYINRIEIEGNTKTRDKVIRREMRIAEGDLYNGTSIAFSRQRIYATGFFDEVKIKTQLKKNDLMDLTVEVKEGRTGTLTAGFGFSSLENFIGTFQASFGNFLGFGQRVRINFEISSRRKSVLLSFLDNYFLDTDWSFGVDLYAIDRNYIDFTKRSYGGQLRVGRILSDFSRFYLSYRIEDVSIMDIRGSELSILFKGGVTSSLSAEIFRDTKDHPFDPTKGNYTYGIVEIAGKYLGGDFDFLKTTLGHQSFFNPLWKFVIMVGAKINYGYELNGRRLPYSERYFVGGIYTVRGFDYNILSPRTRVLSIENEPYSYTREVVFGGNKAVIFNAELIFPIFEEAGIKGVFFFDAGRSFLEEENISLSRIRMGWGFGFRWFTPIAPFRFEWGFPIMRKPGERSVVFEFSIGTFF